MAKFTDAQFRAMLNSDNQLWAKASAGVVTPELCEELGLPEGTKGIVKQIDTPALGGCKTWIYPEDARAYFESFGPTVRAAVEEIRIEQEEAALFKRAEAEKRAAEASAEAGGSAEGTGPESWVPTSPDALPLANEAAAPPHAIFEAGPETFSGRRDALARGISELETYIAEANARLKKYRKEVTALDAALEIMNASEDDEPTGGSAEAIIEGPVAEG